MIIRKVFIIALIMASCSSPKQESTTSETKKIITAGGTITEVVHTLGLGDQIIATDITSTYPASMQSLPSIGYRNQIKAEGILALAPDLVLIEEGYLTPDVISQLKATQVEVRIFAKPKSVDGSKQLVKDLASYFGLESTGQEIIDSIDGDIADLESYLASQSDRPKAIFLMARGPETVFIAGDKTFAEEIFGIAKIESVATGFDEFVPLAPEALLSINPDYVVLFDSGLESLGGLAGLGKIQGLDQTTAFQKQQIVTMDGHYLSGFGPRVGKAALELAKSVRK